MVTFCDDDICGSTETKIDDIPNLALVATTLENEPQNSSSSTTNTTASPRKRSRDDDLDSEIDVCVTSDKKLCLPSDLIKCDALLEVLPYDIWHQILGYCGTRHDRFAVQMTCKLFRQISNESSELLSTLILGGDIMGRGSVLRDEDTPIVACHKLSLFCRAGNLEAMYMYVTNSLITNSLECYSLDCAKFFLTLSLFLIFLEGWE
jgi:hypothetical protein